MSVIDIRTSLPEPVKAVRFADARAIDCTAQADLIVVTSSAKDDLGDIGQVQIKEEVNGDYVRINGVEHCRFLINALEYLIKEGVLK